ncbi:hypothetical protein ABL57_17955 [Kocuria sp. SM24M-10]|nr:hypothetical protein ABL57_17955 [Kocuria sp. SM24M-10]
MRCQPSNRRPRTACSSRSGAAGPGRRCCRPRRASRPRARKPSAPGWRPCRWARSTAHRPGRATRSPGPGASPAATPPAQVAEVYRYAHLLRASRRD